MNTFKTRTELLQLIEPNSNILEIGVFEGSFSKELLSTTPNELYLVDIWSGGWGSGDKDGNNHTHIHDMENVYLSLYETYKELPNVHVIRSSSESFLKNMKENILDVIYVDGDHDEHAVYNDMKNSFDIIKDGGWLMGHDYHHQIKRSVDRFCSDCKQEISYVAMDGCPSFAIKVTK